MNSILTDEFDRLVRSLRKSGYRVTLSDTADLREDPVARIATVRGKWILGVFGENLPTVWYRQHRGRLAADHVRCYNKPQQCPLVMRIDRSPEEIIQQLKDLGTPRGFEISNSFSYFDSNPWTYDLED